MKCLANTAVALVFIWSASSAYSQVETPAAATAPATAGSPSPVAQKAPPRFMVKVGAMVIPDQGSVPTMVILAEQTKITFMPPRGCSSSVNDAEQKVTFSSTKAQLAFSVRVAKGMALPDDAGFMQRLQEIYPGAQFQPIYAAVSTVAEGRYCDIRQAFKNGNVMMTRHAFIPITGGCLEVILTTDFASFETQRSVFTWMMNSLKIEPRLLSE